MTWSELNALCNEGKVRRIVPNHQLAELDRRLDDIMKRTNICLADVEQEISQLCTAESTQFQARPNSAEARVKNANFHIVGHSTRHPTSQIRVRETHWGASIS
jgi:hypothetical protein